jgi:hypothetical protein
LQYLKEEEEEEEEEEFVFFAKGKEASSVFLNN